MTVVARGRGGCAGGARQGATGSKVGVAGAGRGRGYGQVAEGLCDAADLGGARVANGLADVGGEVDDELSVDNKVIVGLFKVQGKHLCERVSEGAEAMRERKQCRCHSEWT